MINARRRRHPSRFGVGALLSGVCVLTATLSGCGSASPERVADPPSASTPNQPPPGPAVSASPAVQASPASLKTVLFMVCSGATLDLINIDTTSGSMLEPRTTAAPCISGGSGAPVLVRRQDVSPDFSRIAMRLADGSDGSMHVGWTMVDTGEIVDVTAVIASAAGAMSAVPKDILPTFAPNGEFVFVDTLTGLIVFVDPRTRSVTHTGFWAIHGYPLYISPDGSADFMGYSAFASATEMPGAPGSMFCDRWDNPVQVWVGDGTAIRRDAGRVSVVRTTAEKPGSGCNGEEVVRFLTPESDYRIGPVVLDRETSTVYFTATRGEEMQLFSAPLDGSVPPTVIAALSDIAHAYTGPLALEALGVVQAFA